jgi:hypothetical protein
MNAPSAFQLKTVVPPGGQVAVSVNFMAPNQEGTYTSNWKIKADNGIQFAQVWVKIKVTAFPRPTSPLSDIDSITSLCGDQCPYPS